MNRLLIGAFLALTLTAAWAENAPALLAEVDARRFVPDMDFELTITSYQGDKALDSNSLWGWVKAIPDGNKTLLAFVEPGSVKGRKMLMDGNVVYFLFPRTRNPIRLSPLQVLLGQTSNGDVARTGFSQDYDVVSLEEAPREGVPCYRFSLAAKPSKEDSTYKRVELWVERSTLRPLYAEFFASTDKPLKRAYYKDYREAEGKDFPFTLDIFDGEDRAKHTVMAYSKIGRKPMADTAFRREYLESWNPEPLK